MNMLTLLLESSRSITSCSDVADTSIRTTGPQENPFYSIYWLAKEYEEHQIMQHHPNTAQSPTLRLWYLSNYHDALQAHMHTLHKLGNANAITNNHEYYQTLIKDGTVNGFASNAYLKTSYVPVKSKCITMKYRTGKLYNQSMRYGLSTQ
jgi:hypothetical protein